MKANRKLRNDDNGFAGALGGAVIGGTIMFMVAIVLNLALLPSVDDSAAQAKNSQNATPGEKGIVSIDSLIFAAFPIIGLVGGGIIGYQHAKAA